MVVDVYLRFFLAFAPDRAVRTAPCTAGPAGDRPRAGVPTVISPIIPPQTPWQHLRAELCPDRRPHSARSQVTDSVVTVGPSPGRTAR